jgi:hypothetical protein
MDRKRHFAEFVQSARITSNVQIEREATVPHRKAIITLSLLVFALGAWAQTSLPPQYSSGPVTDYNAALPNSSDVLQFRRSEQYNIPNPSVPELGENSEPTLVDLPPTHFQRNPMPFDISDAVVVGKITAGQAYLSNDKRNIYSEFRFSVDEVIKTPTAPYLRVGESIDIERSGGVVKLPSGKVILRGAVADSMPLIGKCYLLFLRYNPNTEDYHLQTGYQIEGGHIYRLDDQNYAESNHTIRARAAERVNTSNDRLRYVSDAFSCYANATNPSE